VKDQSGDGLSTIDRARSWGPAVDLRLLRDLPANGIRSDQAMEFGALMSFAGLVILSLGLSLSETFAGEFTTPVTGLQMQLLRNISLPHCSRVSQRQFFIIFRSKRRTDSIPSINSSSSAIFLRDNCCHRSDAGAAPRTAKNSCRISSSVKPSCRALWMTARR
jgi:hypothetical protein